MSVLEFVKLAYADGPAATTLVTTTETVVTTLPGISTTPEQDRVMLEAAASITTGTGATSIQVRIRRGTTAAGAQVGATYTRQIGAALTDHASLQVSDTPGEAAGQQYVVTVQQVAATANGTANAASVKASY